MFIVLAGLALALCVTGFMAFFLTALFQSGNNVGKAQHPPEFSVEFYPITNAYYPKHNGNLLGTRAFTGIIEHWHSMNYAASFSTEEEAVKYLKKFREQQFKINVITKDVSEKVIK